MATPLLTTKLYIPPVRPDPSTGLPSTVLGAGRARLVSRPRLIERLNAGLHRKLTPMRYIGISPAPAGFGEMTLEQADQLERNAQTHFGMLRRDWEEKQKLADQG